ncbi:MAG: uncharacterized protein KVP18_004574 [Porospora cf. gigantea A]|uniref:uncharacterized protein n=2 Tax=Porospora cf. gigantea A TaxID=2853593 RepID=UPI00355AC67B|nr:MAG: hypothetical protein KVP18_004574 [Porospora cf. gigantea A]
MTNLFARDTLFTKIVDTAGAEDVDVVTSAALTRQAVILGAKYPPGTLVTLEQAGVLEAVLFTDNLDKAKKNCACVVSSSVGLKGTFSLAPYDGKLSRPSEVRVALKGGDAHSLWTAYDALRSDTEYQRILLSRLEAVPLPRKGRDLGISYRGVDYTVQLSPIDSSEVTVFLCDSAYTKLNLLPPAIRSRPAVSETVTPKKIGGLDSVLQQLVFFLGASLLRPELFEHSRVKPPRGVLLYGPPGTGKTLLASCFLDALKERARELNVLEPELVVLESVLIMSSSDPESALKEVFAEAEARGGATVLFIDEIDALCPKREDSGELERRLVSIMLSELDGIRGTSRLVLLATTNRPDSLDEALRRSGRLDREVEIGVPSPAGRREILDVLLDGTNHECSSAEIESIAEDAHGFVGADLASVVQAAFLESVAETTNISRAHLRRALKNTIPSGMREVSVEIPQVPWSAIGGYEETKMRLRECVEWPLIHRDLFEQVRLTPPKGVLLYGPPGCSKTLLARAVASQSKMNFINVKGPTLFSKYVGDSEKQVRDVFARARRNAPCVIFLDEIDAIGASREGGSGVEARVLTLILTEMDGMGGSADVIVIGATNRPDVLDAALVRPGRLDRIVYVPLPDSQARKEIFRVHLKELPLLEALTDDRLDQLAEGSDRLSGAEIAGAIREVVTRTVRDILSQGATPEKVTISYDVLLDQTRKTKPRTSPESEAWFDNYFNKG